MNKTLRIILPVIVLGVSSAIAWKILENPTEARKLSSMPETRLRVQVQTMEAQTFTPAVRSYGEIQAKVSGSLVAEVAGKLVFISPKLVAGGKFQKGDKLAQIDPRQYETELIVAEGNLATANFKLEEEIALGQQAEANWQKIGQANIATSLALRKPHLVAAKAQVRSAQALLEQAKLNLEKTSLLAPYAGYVRHKYSDIGQYLSANTVIADIFGSDALEIHLPVSLSELALLDIPESKVQAKTLAQASIIIEPTQGIIQNQWRAQLMGVEHVLDPQSRQVNLIAEIKTPPGTEGSSSLKIGQFVKASIDGRPLVNVFVIPRRALHQNDTVYLAASNRLVKSKVELIWSDENNAVVKGGLKAGDNLITTPLANPVSGTLLSTEQAGLSDDKTPEG